MCSGYKARVRQGIKREGDLIAVTHEGWGRPRLHQEAHDDIRMAASHGVWQILGYFLRGEIKLSLDERLDAQTAKLYQSLLRMSRMGGE